MKNVTLDRATALQLDANGTDSALDAAADCNALRNDVALDLCAIADQEIRGAQLAFDSTEDLRWTIAFDLADDRHVGADARGRSRPCGRLCPRPGLVMRLHRRPYDFARICRRIPILLGCAVLHAIQHLYLLYFASAKRQVRSHLSTGLRKPSFNALQIGVYGWYRGRGWVVFFLRARWVDAGRWLDWILNPPRRSFKLRVLVDRQRPMKNVTFDRATRARDLFSNRVLLLHHPLHDFGRICCRVLNLPGCLAFEEHVHLRFRRHAVQKGPKGCRAATSRKRRAFKLRCRLRIRLRKPELPLRWSLRVRAIPCTVPCQGFHFLPIRASQHPLRP